MRVVTDVPGGLAGPSSDAVGGVPDAGVGQGNPHVPFMNSSVDPRMAELLEQSRSEEPTDRLLAYQESHAGPCSGVVGGVTPIAMASETPPNRRHVAGTDYKESSTLSSSGASNVTWLLVILL